MAGKKAFTLEVNGVKELNAAFARLVEHDAPDAVVGKLYRLGEAIMAESKGIVPVDTGALMNSGKVMPPAVDGDRVVVTLGYGDAAVDYAIPVHEIPPERATHTPPRRWKYLEEPVLAATDRLTAELAAALAEAAARAGRR